jgi:transcription antitermination factor NusG
MLAAGDDLTRRWYVVRTIQHREARARDAIRAIRSARVEVYLPVERRELRDGAISAVALFPCYIFVRLPRLCDQWREVLTARYVRAVLGGHDRMLFLADVVIERVRAQEIGGFIELNESRAVTRVFEDRQHQFNYEFSAGEKVTVRRGPLAGLDAIVAKDVRGGRTAVMLKLLDESQRLARMVTLGAGDVARSSV